jgi:hypothetical protein
MFDNTKGRPHQHGISRNPPKRKQRGVRRFHSEAFGEPTQAMARAAFCDQCDVRPKFRDGIGDGIGARPEPFHVVDEQSRCRSSLNGHDPSNTRLAQMESTSQPGAADDLEPPRRAKRDAQFLIAIGAMFGGIVTLLGAPAVFRFPSLRADALGGSAITGWSTVLVGIVAILWAGAVPLARIRRGPARFWIITLGVAVASFGVAWFLIYERMRLQAIFDLLSDAAPVPRLTIAVVGAVVVCACATAWLVLEAARKRRAIKR